VGDTVNPEEDTLRWFENLFYLTSAGGKKVGIIHDVDRMQQAAQNAFLKTLEEPPGNTLFMLTTGNPSKLLPTTVSRCQLIMLITNKCSYALNHMERLKNILRELQFNSSGNLIKAERCAREIVNISAKIDSEAQKIVGAKWSEQLERAAEELEAPALKRMKNRIDAAERAEYLRQRTYFISAIHTWFAQVFHIASGASADRIANPELFEGIQLPDRISPSGAFKALEHAEKLTYDLNYNIKEELALRVFCLNVAMNS
jgi:DNA polymerase-3 subunit delta'